MSGRFRRLIVGGLSVSVDRAPFVVRLYTSARFTGFCGGTLIAERTVLTAAHCIQDPAASIYVGTYHSTIYAGDAEPRSDVVAVNAVFVHPDYNTSITQGNDVAVLSLARTPKHMGELAGPHAIPLDDGSF